MHRNYVNRKDIEKSTIVKKNGKEVQKLLRRHNICDIRAKVLYKHAEAHAKDIKQT